MYTPTTEQQRIIDHFNGHALVVAGPGSGKTVTLIAHVKKLVLVMKIPPDDIWVMAFNRDISLKLKEKIQAELKAKSPQTTTIHAFILSQTLRHGAELLDSFEIAEALGKCGRDQLLWKPIAKRLREKHGIRTTAEGKRLDIRHVRGLLWNQLRDYWLTSDMPTGDLFHKFNSEVERSKALYGLVFLDELALKFLDAIKTNPRFRKEVVKPRLVIDEFQDLNPTEHAILQQFDQEGASIVAFGDDDQAVNDFRRAHADYIHEFASAYSPTQYPLKRDRRCPKEILELADEFVKGLVRLDKPVGYTSHPGRVDILNFSTDEHEEAGVCEITKKYLSLSSASDEEENPEILVLSATTGRVTGRSRIGDIIARLADIGITDVTGQKREDPFDNQWGLAFRSLLEILTGKPSPSRLAAFLSVARIRCMQDVNEYIDQQERKGRSLDFRTAFLEVSKNSGSVQVLVADIDRLRNQVKEEAFNPSLIADFIPSDLSGEDKALSIVATVWEEIQSPGEASGSSSELDLEALTTGQRFLQLLRRYVDENVLKPEFARTHVTTYRKAKGLEADLVIVTSVDSADFSDNGQKRRLLYVSATRSSKNLILTFAATRSGARRFARSRPQWLRGRPRVFRSPLIPSAYPTHQFSQQWLSSWKPV